MPEIATVTPPIKMSGYRALTEAAAWFRLPGRGLLAVSGEDRVRFLNAMLTGDLRKLAAGEGCYAFSLDARGRVVSDAGVYVFADEILLDTEPEGTAALRDHLEQHLIADDAEWRPLEDEFCAIAVEGPQSEERLRAITGELPSHPWRYSVAGGMDCAERRHRTAGLSSLGADILVGLLD